MLDKFGAIPTAAASVCLGSFFLMSMSDFIVGFFLFFFFFSLQVTNKYKMPTGRKLVQASQDGYIATSLTHHWWARAHARTRALELQIAKWSHLKKKKRSICLFTSIFPRHEFNNYNACDNSDNIQLHFFY